MVDVPYVGMKVIRFFPKNGWYYGSVSEIVELPKKMYKVIFKDGETDEWTEDEYAIIKAESKVVIGDVGYKFVRVWRRGKLSAAYDGEVIIIRGSGLRKCLFNDGKSYIYPLSEIERCSKLQYVPEVDLISSSSDKSDVDSDDDMSSSSSSRSEDSVCNSVSISEATSQGIYLQKLLKVPLDELEARKTSKEAFSDAIQPCIDAVTERFSNLDIDGRNIEVRQWPKDEDLKLLTEELLRYDPNFSREIKSRALLGKMPFIKEFMSCEKHYRETSYCIEFKLCGEDECGICRRIGRRIRTPVTTNGELRKEVNRFLDLPILDKARNNEHFMTPEKTREYINKNNPSIDKLLEHLPKKGISQSKEQLEDKEEDKNNKAVFATSKLRMWVQCDCCGARRCIYSKNAVGSTNGPSNKDMEKLLRWKDNDGYVCGNRPGNKKILMKIQQRCGEQIETQYFDSIYITGQPKTKGRTISTDPVCCLCYDTHNMVVKGTKTNRKQDLKGKNLLPVCMKCFNNAIENTIKLPTTGGSSNKKTQGMQNRESNKRLHATGIATGRRKKRK
jgi:hypothetical protein